MNFSPHKFKRNLSISHWGTTLQAGRSRVRFPMRSLIFFSLSNPYSRIMTLGSTQPLTEVSTRNLPGNKGRPARKADNLNVICELIVRKMWEPRRLTTLWASTACYRDKFTFLPLRITLNSFIHGLFDGTFSI
jgi:hypothetical protein